MEQPIKRFVLAHPADGTRPDPAYDPFRVGGTAEEDHAWRFTILRQLLTHAERGVVGNISIEQDYVDTASRERARR
jgi:hypothetical protein